MMPGIQQYCFINPRRFMVNDRDPVFLESASAEKSLAQVYQRLGLNYLKFFKMDNLSKLAFLAAESVMKGWDPENIKDKKDISLVLANASSSLVTDANYQLTINDQAAFFPSPSLFVYTLPNICIGEICIRHKIYGENVFFVQQKFDASLLYFYVNEKIKSGQSNQFLVGWVECNSEDFEAFMMLVGAENIKYAFDKITIDQIYNQNKD